MSLTHLHKCPKHNILRDAKFNLPQKVKSSYIPEENVILPNNVEMPSFTYLSPQRVNTMKQEAYICISQKENFFLQTIQIHRPRPAHEPISLLFVVQTSENTFIFYDLIQYLFCAITYNLDKVCDWFGYVPQIRAAYTISNTLKTG